MRTRIIDKSGDKNYFTIIPNYILNHSSATDQALYLQMKRVAGENGECFISEESFCKKMKVGKDKLRKSIKYLIKHKWISFVGRKHGKTSPVNTYKINDIWGLNSEFYVKKKSRPKTANSSNIRKESSQNRKESSQIGRQSRPKTDYEEEPINKNQEEEENDDLKKYISWAYKRANTKPSCGKEAFIKAVQTAIHKLGKKRVDKIFGMETNAITFLKNLKYNTKRDRY